MSIRYVTETLVLMPDNRKFSATDVGIPPTKITALCRHGYVRIAGQKKHKKITMRGSRRHQCIWMSNVYELTDLGRARRAKGLRK